MWCAPPTGAGVMCHDLSPDAGDARCPFPRACKATARVAAAGVGPHAPGTRNPDPGLKAQFLRTAAMWSNLADQGSMDDGEASREIWTD